MRTRAPRPVITNAACATACDPGCGPAGQFWGRFEWLYWAGSGQAVPPLVLDVDGRWIGSGVCYGPQRDGQRPGGPAPTDAELAEDLALMAPRWHLLRIYGADDARVMLLAIYQNEKRFEDVLAILQERYGHVSAERAVCGAGLVDLFGMMWLVRRGGYGVAAEWNDPRAKR